jgi:hypothetical protein
MAIITTTRGDLDDAQLVKREGVIDNENETTTWTEYCLLACAGPHLDGESCARHVHRSVHVTLKKWPDGLGAVLADLQ